MAIIEIKGVRQSFKSGFWMTETEVLKGIDFSVQRNSVYGLLGPNGAGKTTLIHLITGLRKPTAGHVKINGHDSASVQARSKIGYLPERPYFHEYLTGEALLIYMGTLSGMKQSRLKERIPVVLKQVTMEHAKNVELRRYSKGMLQRIGLAQAILHDPEILILDEPMSGLDPLGRKEIRELILQLAKEGKTIFFSSHVIPDVEAICQQVAVIEKGHLTSCGPIADFLESEDTTAEVAFAGLEDGNIDVKGVRLLSVDKISGGHRVIVDSQKNISQVVKVVIEKGGQLMWATPNRRSLESLFDNRSSK